MISLQMLDSILTTPMTPGQLLNDSAAGNAINHLQLTFISSPPHAAAQPVLFTVTAHPESPPHPSHPHPPLLSSACLILYIPLAPARSISAKCTAVKTIISRLFPNSAGSKSFCARLGFAHAPVHSHDTRRGAGKESRQD